MRRANLYADLGADATFVEAPRGQEELELIGRETKVGAAWGCREDLAGSAGRQGGAGGRRGAWGAFMACRGCSRMLCRDRNACLKIGSGRREGVQSVCSCAGVSVRLRCRARWGNCSGCGAWRGMWGKREGYSTGCLVGVRGRVGRLT